MAAEARYGRAQVARLHDHFLLHIIVSAGDRQRDGKFGKVALDLRWQECLGDRLYIELISLMPIGRKPPIPEGRSFHIRFITSARLVSTDSV